MSRYKSAPHVIAAPRKQIQSRTAVLRKKGNAVDVGGRWNVPVALEQVEHLRLAEAVAPYPRLVPETVSPYRTTVPAAVPPYRQAVPKALTP
eukprot:48853-Rhodomonas_salina.1